MDTAIETQTLRTRHVVLVALVAMLLLAVTGIRTPARAAHCPPGNQGGAFGGICYHPPGGGSGGGGVTNQGSIYDVALTTVGGEQCWQIEVGGTMTWAEAAAMLASFDNNGTLYNACVYDPVALTAGLWTALRCPPPLPQPVTLDPTNEATVGLEGYLSIGTPPTVDIACGPGIVVATPRFVIDWGDGTTTETTSRGGEYPDGDLTHVWTQDGTPTITVEAWWRGSFAGVDLGELTVPTTTTLPVVVTERQGELTG